MKLKEHSWKKSIVMVATSLALMSPTILWAQSEGDNLNNGDKKQTQASSSSNNKFVVLDARGTQHKVPRSIFSSPYLNGSMLGIQFSGQYADEKQEDGSYFLDINGENLKPIIHFLSRGNVHLQTWNIDQLNCLIDDVEYLGIEALLEKIQKVKAEIKFNHIMPNWRSDISNFVKTLIDTGDIESFKQLDRSYLPNDLKIEFKSYDSSKSWKTRSYILNPVLIYVASRKNSLDENKMIDIMKILIKNGFDVNVKDVINDYNSLHYSVEANYLKLTKFLLKHGVAKNYGTYHLSSPHNLSSRNLELRKLFDTYPKDKK